MKTTTLALCAALTLSTSTAYADDALPQLNMSEDMITKEMAHEATGAAAYMPLIILVGLALLSATKLPGGCVDKECFAIR